MKSRCISNLSDKLPYNKYVNVVYNPEGFCIDSRTAQTLDEIKNNDVTSSYQQNRLPPINISPISSGVNSVDERRFTVNTRLTNAGSSTKEDLEEQAYPFYHSDSVYSSKGSLAVLQEKQWLVDQSYVKHNGEQSLNKRSNAFLISYYDHLDKRRSVADEYDAETVFSTNSDIHLGNRPEATFENTQLEHNLPLEKSITAGQRLTYENINKNTIPLIDIMQSTKAQKPASQKEKLPVLLQNENERATCWLRSYVNVAHAQNVNWYHVLQATDDMIKQSKKYR